MTVTLAYALPGGSPVATAQVSINVNGANAPDRGPGGYDDDGARGGDGGDAVDTNSTDQIGVAADAYLGTANGGKGGNGGYGVSGTPVHTNGGEGGNGGDGGSVDITNTARLSTVGDYHSGVVATALGGRGGDGGGAAPSITAESGDAGHGGVGGSAVAAMGQGSNIVTLGKLSYGIYLDASGGDGGTGGDFDLTGIGAGGNGGNGASGGYASGSNAGLVDTSGWLSHGMIVRSAGGRGGDGKGGTGIIADGGNGGAATSGGTVEASNFGSITTRGEFAIGMLAQSVGGGGGDGGGVFGFFGGGGTGSAGNHGGSVTATNQGSIVTYGSGAIGMLVESVGGGGGDGGGAVGVVSIGGRAGGGGNGGVVNASLGGSITTGAGGNGDGAHGALIQSVGGGGGNGGYAVAATPGIVSVAVGGGGGTGGSGGLVTVNATAGGLAVRTDGHSAVGILAQSVGGGGGNGGGAFALSGVASVAVGGSGGAAGDGGEVRYSLANADVTTQGKDSTGILVQSVGGGGGNGGFAIAGAGLVAVAVGGGGDSGGDGGAVAVTAGGSVQTAQDRSAGMIVQSLGGGGGNGGFDVSGSIGVAVGVGGSGGGGGGGGAVAFQTAGSGSQAMVVTTRGDDSTGLIAQSIGGGGGNGGFSVAGSVGVSVGVGGGGGSASDAQSVSVAYDGTVDTYGDRSEGIVVQSVGGGGGNGGFATGLSLGVAVNVGGSGAGGGAASSASYDSGGTWITTRGSDSAGLVVQSIAGGGGNGGFAMGLLAGVSVSVGGQGDAAGDASTARATIEGGRVETLGDRSSAIAVQSIGGGGGRGGGTASGAFGLGINVSGSGGGGGAGDTVTVDNAATLVTWGQLSRGIQAQSIGGGGGSGGFSMAVGGPALAVGGAGAGGGSGGTVSVHNTGTIVTRDHLSTGVLAQSVGGGGGDGGMTGTGALFAAVSIARSGGGGGNGGRVSVGNQADIRTYGDLSDGIMAQSIGGGGGNGGAATAASIGVFGSVGVAVGGAGGDGRDGGAVTVDHAGRIEVAGQGSRAIVAQSVGGGGGNGGEAYTEAFSAGLYVSVAAAVSVGGSGGDGGSGGNVTVTADGALIGTTAAAGSGGIVAQSIGGGGGTGGRASSFAGSLSTAASINAGVSVGGAGGSGGRSGDVTVRTGLTDGGTIETSGFQSVGILAQSIAGGGGLGGDSLSGAQGNGVNVTVSAAVAVGGGGGDGNVAGNVLVDNDMGISTAGDASGAIVAQSIGGGGGMAGFAIGDIDHQPLGNGVNVQAVVGVGGGGGLGNHAGNVTVASSGVLRTQGVFSAGITAQSIGGGGGIGGASTARSTGTGMGGSETQVGAQVSVGGGGGVAGDSRAVSVTNNGIIMTDGYGSTGLLAMALGGGGGLGGDASAEGALGDPGSSSSSDSGGVTVSVGAAIGLAGGSGGLGGEVTVVNNGLIATRDAMSAGIQASSIGGGGGSGGAASAGATADVALGAAIAGGGGDGSAGGNVDVHSGLGSAVWTAGENSTGIMAQSIGGGGGTGGVGASTGSDGGTVDIKFALGGMGGDGSKGGAVLVDSQALILTEGANSHAILAQSIGGGGGVGAASGTTTKDAQVAIGLALGGFGGEGGLGGQVHVIQGPQGSIATMGNGSYGILAQSIGGGGGVAGTASASGGGDESVAINAAVGGFAGDGRNGGAVTVDNNANIVTRGNQALGILAQSVGGGGGVGGAGQSSGNGSVAVALSMGGLGGNGGLGDTVRVNNGAVILTAGVDSHGILAQSIGGGGGAGGASRASGTAESVSVGLSLGGMGGDGARGGAVHVVNAGTAVIETQGSNSYGVLAQSVGGGGGAAGASSASGGGDDAVAVNLAIGGWGGLGSDGGVVAVDNDAAIYTYGVQSIGILAQSVGGGGGVAGAGQSAGNGSVTVGLALGGFGGDGGIGGQVRVNNTSRIQTMGADAHAILAQSVGGGGGNGAAANISGSASDVKVGLSVGGAGGAGAAGGSVRVENTQQEGWIGTQGDRAYGILAQSIGGGGGTAGSSAASGPGDEDAVAVNLTIGGMGGDGSHGGTVTVLNAASVQTRGAQSLGIFAQSVGGGGGVAGGGQSNGTGKVSVGLSIGGFGGDGGNGGVVRVDNSGGIYTQGVDAHGIQAQSIGGGGGSGAGAGVSGAAQETAVSLALGGMGGAGASGGRVTVNNTASGWIETRGGHAYGIFAQSIGGGGGSAGAGQVGNDAKQATTVDMAIGGAGGDASHGGSVTVGNAGVIVTRGELSHGIFAQSVGGGGGESGAASSSSNADMAIGALLSLPGGSGSNGGHVVVDNDGLILTQGAGALGIFAQSVGGGGGYGGSVSTNSSSLQVGGGGGSGGNGGDVNVTVSGAIVTQGAQAHGVVAQSIGGGGGYGGGALAEGDATAIAIGGFGGDGGNGGDVTVIRSGTITTQGPDSIAIIAQSVGGGGGMGGAGFGRFNTDDFGLGVDAIPFQSPPGSKGDGGKVVIVQTGAIQAQGMRSHGVVAQAVGGGGGAGGSSSFAHGQSGAGSNGGIGDAAPVDATVRDQVWVRGASSYALFGQSATGRGDASGVALVAGDSLFAQGKDSVAAYAESTGSGRRGPITLDLNGPFTIGGSGSGQAVMLVGGSVNRVTNHSLLFAGGEFEEGGFHSFSLPSAPFIPLDAELAPLLGGFSPLAISGTSGDDQVDNLPGSNALGRIIGNVDLGSGNNGLHNFAGASFVGLQSVNLGGGGNLFLNDGVFSIKGIGVAGTMDLDGDFTQTGTGQFVVDIDLDGQVTDRLRMTGSGDFAGVMPLNFLSIDKLFEEYGVATDVGMVDSGIQPLTQHPTVGFKFRTKVVDGSDLVLYAEKPSFASMLDDPASGVRDAGAGQMANYLDGVEATASPANPMARLINMLRFLPDEQQYGSAMIRLTPHYAVHSLDMVNRSVDELMDFGRRCDYFQRDAEGRHCLWLRVTPDTKYVRDPGSGATRRDDHLHSFSMGGLSAVGPRWSLGAMAGYTEYSSRVTFGEETLSDTTGDGWQAHFLARYQKEAFRADFSLGGGAANFDGSRDTYLAQVGYIPGETLGGDYLSEVLLPGIGASVDYRQKSKFVGASVRAAYRFQGERAYLEPSVRFDARWHRISGQESGSLAAMRFDGTTNGYFAVTPGVEVGSDIELTATTSLGVYANAGVRFTNSQWKIKGQFNAADSLGAKPLYLTESLDSPRYLVGAGLELKGAKGLGLAVQYSGEFGKNVRQNSVSAQLRVRF